MARVYLWLTERVSASSSFSSTFVIDQARLNKIPDTLSGFQRKAQSPSPGDSEDTLEEVLYPLIRNHVQGRTSSPLFKSRSSDGARPLPGPIHPSVHPPFPTLVSLQENKAPILIHPFMSTS